MTQEDKELLLKDLSAKLPYGVKICPTDCGTAILIGIKNGSPLLRDTIHDKEYDKPWDIEYIKPYLRPMSSMTEEEMKEYHSLIEEQKNIPYFTFCSCVTRYLDSIHVDHRAIKDKDGKWKTMIQLGLALEAPEGMYNIKEK